jgi:hypothetical protein
MAVQKTTVYLDVDAYRRIKAIAKAEHRAPADLVREAVTEYAGRHARRAAPRSIGIGRSKRGDVSERAEELLAGFGRSR